MDNRDLVFKQHAKEIAQCLDPKHSSVLELFIKEGIFTYDHFIELLLLGETWYEIPTKYKNLI